MIESSLEFCRHVVRHAEAVLHDAPDRHVDAWRRGEARNVSQMGLERRRSETFPTVEQHRAANHAMVDRQLELHISRLVFEVACGRGDGPASLPGFFHPPQMDQRQAARQRKPRPLRDHRLAQPAVGGEELCRPVPEDQARAARTLQYVARERRLLRFDGMAHRCHRLVPAHEHLGNPPVNAPKSLRRLAEAPPGAVLPDQGVQPPHVRHAVMHWLEQPHQDRYRLDPTHRIVALQHLVEERGVHPLEQADIEEKFSVFRPEPGEQPRLHPVLHQLLRGTRILASAPLQLVAGKPEGEWPAGRLRHHCVQPPAGQPAVEEVRDLRAGEAQVVRRQDFGLAVQHGAGDVHAGGELAARESQVQVRRAVAQQEFEQGHRIRAPEPLQIVEHQHERPVTGLDLAECETGAPPAPAAGLSVNR